MDLGRRYHFARRVLSSHSIALKMPCVSLCPVLSAREEKSAAHPYVWAPLHSKDDFASPPRNGPGYRLRAHAVKAPVLRVLGKKRIQPCVNSQVGIRPPELLGINACCV